MFFCIYRQIQSVCTFVEIGKIFAASLYRSILSLLYNYIDTNRLMKGCSAELGFSALD